MAPRVENAADLLRSLRRAQGSSLRTAAADIGVAPSQLSRLERGQRTLAPELSERIADYYNVSRELVALSYGELPPDIVAILQRRPQLIAELRSAYGSNGTVDDG